MAEQVRKEKQESAPQEEIDEVAAKNLTNEELDADIDSILDEIDDVLEVNAEQFVASFIQKGGE